MTLSSRSPNLQRRTYRGQNLSHVDFSGMNLIGVDFTDAILDGANLSHADLRGAIFRRSSLIGTNLQFSRSGVAKKRQLILTAISIVIGILAGIGSGFIGSSTAGLLTNDSNILAAYNDVKFLLSWHTITGTIIAGAAIAYGYYLQHQNLATATMMTGSSIIAAGNVLAIAVISACLNSDRSWTLVGQMMLAILGLVTMLAFNLIFMTIAVAILVNVIGSKLQVMVTITIGLMIALISVANTNSSILISLGAIVGVSEIAYLGLMMGKRSKSHSSTDRIIRTIGTYISTYFGTCFDRANLTGANFQSASLLNTNLSRANLTHTNFYGVSHLDTAKLDRTILSDSIVRDLLVSHRGKGDRYVGCNFAGAYLAGADLCAADLTGADLSNADLSSALLDGANLTRIVGTGADLQAASLTGACIADWAIDRTTQLEGISCDYIYLKAPGAERNPASGSFKAGDFTRLFQEIWNTVDLIFHHGIDWTSFGHTWQQLQIENAGMELAINSIERKGGGTIVVKVEVPLEVDKARFHQDFDRYYQLQLQAATERHQVELAGRDRELAIYRQQQERLQDILQSLVKPATNNLPLERLVTIEIGARDGHGNLSVAVKIGDRGTNPTAAAIGSLEHEAGVITAYRAWQITYRQYLDLGVRIDVPNEQITKINRSAALAECRAQAANLQVQIDRWLNAESFRPIKELMLQELHPSQSIQIVLQTDELPLRQLPFQLWDFFDRFTQAELTISSNIYRSISSQLSTRSSGRMLAIFGHSQGIELTTDRDTLLNLADPNIELLVEPTRQILTERLWERPWDTIFFAGHSTSDRNLTAGYLQINATEKLTIEDLKFALKQAISNGLKLAIINSCDGLGLATELIALQLPQAIVMRELIPDPVAHKFLEYFTIARASGQPLYLAVRAARTRLQGLEDRYPCASWLPVICQNPATIADGGSSSDLVAPSPDEDRTP